MLASNSIAWKDLLESLSQTKRQSAYVVFQKLAKKSALKVAIEIQTCDLVSGAMSKPVKNFESSKNCAVQIPRWNVASISNEIYPQTA